MTTLVPKEKSSNYGLPLKARLSAKEKAAFDAAHYPYSQTDGLASLIRWFVAQPRRTQLQILEPGLFPDAADGRTDEMVGDAGLPNKLGTIPPSEAAQRESGGPKPKRGQREKPPQQ